MYSIRFWQGIVHSPWRLIRAAARHDRGQPQSKDFVVAESLSSSPSVMFVAFIGTRVSVALDVFLESSGTSPASPNGTTSASSCGDSDSDGFSKSMEMPLQKPLFQSTNAGLRRRNKTLRSECLDGNLAPGGEAGFGRSAPVGPPWFWSA